MNKEHLHPEGRPYTKEEFVEKIKTDKSFAKRFGNLGKIYGYQWRSWEQIIKVPAINNVWGTGFEYSNTHIDQIANLISELKTNPDSRRLMVSAWNVGELSEMVLPPCHYGFQVYTRELSLSERCELGYKYIDPFEWDMIMGNNHNDEDICNDYYIPTRAISLMWNQRSVDTFLGLPFNIASYGLLLEIIAKEVNMVPDELIGNLGDVHLYSNHIEQAKEQIGREPFELPTLKIKDGFDIVSGLDDMYEINSFELENYQSHPSIKAPLSN